MTALTSLHLAAQRENWQWRRQQLGPLCYMDIARGIVARLAELDAADYRGANMETSRLARELKDAHVQFAFDEQQVRDHAENYSRLAAKIEDFEARCRFAEGYVTVPSGKRFTRAGIMARLEDALWWRRQLRKRWTRAAENGQRALGMVRKGRAPYASDDALRRRLSQRRKMRDFLERSEAHNLDTAEKIPLTDLAEHSLANPALRRGEFMTRARGLEELANGYGHHALFLTLTTPSRFHAELAGGGRNPAYDPTLTVSDAQRWLCKMWARTRAKLARLKVLMYGFRVAEPHHDGTPHWHALVFLRQRDVDAFSAVLRGVWLSDAGSEPGASAHRVKLEAIDPSKGPAVGYLAKYVSKNIDGKGAIGDEPSDETGERVSDSTGRVDAWASTHGVRQFQEVGTPPVGIWREARRLRGAVADPDIRRAAHLADKGRYGDFVRCLGGLTTGDSRRRATGIRLERIERGERNRYGEARPAAVIGLRCASAVEITRPHRWRIERKSCSNSPLSSHLGPVAITIRGAAALGEPAAWSNPSETSQAPPQ